MTTRPQTTIEHVGHFMRKAILHSDKAARAIGNEDIPAAIFHLDMAAMYLRRAESDTK